MTDIKEELEGNDLKQDLKQNQTQEIDLEKLREEIHEMQDKILRSNAETENLRKRYEKQLVDVREYAVFDFAKELINIMDNLVRALEYKPKEMTTEVKNIIKGIELTYEELKKLFDKHKISAIEANSGDNFDYNYHHAISQEETTEYNKGSIVNVIQTGYKLKDRLLRPAIVSTAKPPTKDNEKNDS